jgi:hypothetical protein
MLKHLFAAAAIVLVCGCSSVDNRMPSEDIEVPVKYQDIISILKDPKLSTNSKEKYDAICDLIDVVDFSFTRETKTINDLLYYGDAAVDFPNAETRTIVFNYQYRNRFVRLIFVVMRNYVLRTEIKTEKDIGTSGTFQPVGSF